MPGTRSAELLSPRQVAEALGVSESSVKRWSDDGLMTTQKTAGGHRKLARADVLRFVREQGYDIGKPELLGLARVPRGPLADKTLHDQLVAALVAGDGEAIRRFVVGPFARGAPLTQLFDELLATALRELGTRWEHGTVRVFEEHRAIELVHRALHELRQLLGRPARRRPHAIVATMTGDPYTVAIAMAELTLHHAGWTVTNFGADNPAETLVEAIASLGPRLVCIGINHVADLDRFAAGHAMISDAARAQRAAVVIGGGRATPELRARIHYATCAANMRELLDFAATLEPRTGAADRATRPRP